MTGFGNARANFENKSITVEMRSVNSKISEFRFRLPLNYRDKEYEIKKILSDEITRGKVEMNLNIIDQDDSNDVFINKRK